MKIAIAGTGYVGLSNAVLLAQHNEVVAIDLIAAKVDQINQRVSPIEDTKQLLANYNDVPRNIMRAIVDSNTTRKDFCAAEILKRNPKVVGIHRLVMKTGCNNFRSTSIQGIMRRLKGKGVEVIVFEPAFTEDKFFNSQVVNDLVRFKAAADVMGASRMTADLDDMAAKVYTRDLFGQD
jgi:UDPglucose 6-dehydrogenase